MTQCDLGNNTQQLPQAYVIHLTGTCCICGTSNDSGDQSSCFQGCNERAAENNCDYFSRSITVRQSPTDPCRFQYQFGFGEEPDAPGPLIPDQLTLLLKKHGEGESQRISMCVELSFEDGGQQTGGPVVWHTRRVTDVANPGVLQRRATRNDCCFPQTIEVSTIPTPDFCPPQPEWLKGHPDDLNDADYWPTVDVPIAQDSEEVPVRYFNGELQLRTKDVGSDGYGFPWGHTRIYSNRLSNSYDFGNGYNWIINELPRLVRRQTSVSEIKAMPHAQREDDSPTGCTMVFLRGTRNAVWFDEMSAPQVGKADNTWQARFGAKCHLVHRQESLTFELTMPNGHRWVFDDFTPDCDPRVKALGEEVIAQRAPGCFKEHYGPGGDVQKITAHYQDGRLCYVRRGVEQFSYEYYEAPDPNEGRIHYVTWHRLAEAGTLDCGNLMRSVYTYYADTKVDREHGNLGDLKTAHTEFWKGRGCAGPQNGCDDPSSMGNQNGEWLRRENAVHYYRYYKDANDTYAQGLLKYYVGPEAYNTLMQTGLNRSASEPMDFVPDHEIELFADLAVVYLQPTNGENCKRYRSIQKISQFAGARKHRFHYNEYDGETKFNAFDAVTVERVPDGSQRVLRTNFIGQPLRLDLLMSPTEASQYNAPADSENSDHHPRWITAWEYDPLHGGVIKKFDPSSLKHNAQDRVVPVPWPGVPDRPTQPMVLPNKGRIHRLGYSDSYLEVEGDPSTYSETVLPHATGYFDSYSMVADGDEQPLISYRLKATSLGLSPPTVFTAGILRFGVSNTAPSPVSVTTIDTTWSTNGRRMRTRITLLPKNETDHFPNAQLLADTSGPQTLETRPIYEEFDLFGNQKFHQDTRGLATITDVDTTKGTPRSEQLRAGDRSGPVVGGFSYDDDKWGRITRITGPKHSAVLPGKEQETAGVRFVVQYIHRPMSGETWTAQGYTLPNKRRLINPIQVDRVDRNGRTTDTLLVAKDVNDRNADIHQEIEFLTSRVTLADVHCVSRVQRVYDDYAHRTITRKFTKILAGEWDSLRNEYEETVTEGSADGRQQTICTPSGTILKSEFDPRGLPTRFSVARDANASFSAVAQLSYDGGSSPQAGGTVKGVFRSGNGELTEIARQVDGRHTRKTSISRDARGRQSTITFPDGSTTTYEYTNQNKVKKVTLGPSTQVAKAGRIADAKLAEKAILYDSRGRVQATQLNGFTNQGERYNPISQKFLYDSADQLIAKEVLGKTSEGRPLNRHTYDIFGRVIVSSLCVETSGSNPQYLVASHNKHSYNFAGDLIESIVTSRDPERLVGSATGALTDSGPTSHTLASGKAVGSRNARHTRWHDPLGRIVAAANYGTEVSSRSPKIETAAKIPHFRSEYNAAGLMQSSVRENGLRYDASYDSAGRLSRSALNLPSSMRDLLSEKKQDTSLGQPIANIPESAMLSDFQYGTQGTAKSITQQNDHTGPQVFNSFFGDTDEARALRQAVAPSNDLVLKDQDPDGQGIEYEYNAAGEVIRATDANGTVHKYERDDMGRIIEDRIERFGHGSLDQTVTAIKYGYDDYGRLFEITSLSANKTHLNQVERRYGTFHELLVEKQLHSPTDIKDLKNLKLAFFDDFDQHNAAFLESDNLTLRRFRDRGILTYAYEYPNIQPSEDNQNKTLRVNDFPRNGLRRRAMRYPSGRWITHDRENLVAPWISDAIRLQKQDAPENRSGLSLEPAHKFFSTLPSEMPAHTLDSVLGRTAVLADWGFEAPGNHQSEPHAHSLYEYWGAGRLYSQSVVNHIEETPGPLKAVGDTIRLAINAVGTKLGPFQNLDFLARTRNHEWYKTQVELKGRPYLHFWHSRSTSIYQLLRYGWRGDGVLKSREYISPSNAKFLDEVFDSDNRGRRKRHEIGKGNSASGPLKIPTPRQVFDWDFDSSGNRLSAFQAGSDFGNSSEVREHTPANRIKKIKKKWRELPLRYDKAGHLEQVPDPDPALDSSALTLTYDGWGRLVACRRGTNQEIARYAYDGLGRRIMSINGAEDEVTHHYYDDRGNTLAEYEGSQEKPNGTAVREYIWDAVRSGRVVAVIDADDDTYYPLYDPMGNVETLLDNKGQIVHRYQYDSYGHFIVRNGSFGVITPSVLPCEFLFAGLQYDSLLKWHRTPRSVFHRTLGRLLPSGSVTVLPETLLNTKVEDFPHGKAIPHISVESRLQGLSEDDKFAIGLAGIALAVGAIAFTVLTAGVGWALVAAAGAVTSAVYSMWLTSKDENASTGDYFMAAGLGAGLGASGAGIGALVIGGAGYALGSAFNWWDPWEGLEWGGLFGGILGGSIAYALRGAAKNAVGRALMKGIRGAAVEITTAGAGAAIAYKLTGNRDWAMIGAIGGAFAGGLALSIGGRLRAQPPGLARSRPKRPAFGMPTGDKPPRLTGMRDTTLSSGPLHRQATELLSDAAGAEGRVLTDILDEVLVIPKGGSHTSFTWSTPDGKRLAVYFREEDLLLDAINARVVAQHEIGHVIDVNVIQESIGVGRMEAFDIYYGAFGHGRLNTLLEIAIEERAWELVRRRFGTSEVAEQKHQATMTYLFGKLK